MILQEFFICLYHITLNIINKTSVSKVIGIQKYSLLKILYNRVLAKCILFDTTHFSI